MRMSERMIDGRYLMLQPLGGGGSGDVYLVRDCVSGDTAAVKVLRIDELSPAEQAHFRKRFEHEARTLAKLHHDNVIALRSFRAQPEAPYLVLEHFDGVPFLRVDAHRCLPLALMLFDALDYLHTRGVLHRDVSSGNVLVRGTRELKLIDFGIALGPRVHRITRAGGTLGKAGAIDPFVLAQGGQGWSTKSDIYSAGVLLYRALLGRRPHAAPSDRRIDQLAANMLNRIIRPREIEPRFSRALESLLLAMLETEPTRRPTAKEARDELRMIVG